MICLAYVLIFQISPCTLCLYMKEVLFLHQILGPQLISEGSLSNNSVFVLLINLGFVFKQAICGPSTCYEGDHLKTEMLMPISLLMKESSQAEWVLYVWLKETFESRYFSFSVHYWKAFCLQLKEALVNCIVYFYLCLTLKFGLQTNFRPCCIINFLMKR